MRRTLTPAQQVRTADQVVFDSLIERRYQDGRAGNPERQKTVVAYWHTHISPWLHSAIDAPDGPCIQDIVLEVGHESSCTWPAPAAA